MSSTKTVAEPGYVPSAVRSTPSMSPSTSFPLSETVAVPAGARRAAWHVCGDCRRRGLNLDGAGGSVRRVPAPELDGNHRAVCGVRAGSADQRARGRGDRRVTDVRRRCVTGGCMGDLHDAHRAGGGVAAADLDDAAALRRSVAAGVADGRLRRRDHVADRRVRNRGRRVDRYRADLDDADGLAGAIALVDRCRLGRA